MPKGASGANCRLPSRLPLLYPIRKGRANGKASSPIEKIDLTDGIRAANDARPDSLDAAFADTSAVQDVPGSLPLADISPPVTI